MTFDLQPCEGTHQSVLHPETLQVKGHGRKTTDQEENKNKMAARLRSVEPPLGKRPSQSQ